MFRKYPRPSVLVPFRIPPFLPRFGLGPSNGLSFSGKMATHRSSKKALVRPALRSKVGMRV